MTNRMSIDSVMSRIAEIQGAVAPAAPVAAAGPPSSFAATLQGAMAAPAAAAPGTYPHLSGDLDANPELLGRLEALAAQRGERFTITSGNRTYAEQERLWNARGSNPYPVAHPGSSRHESGNAADVTIGGRAIQDVIGAAELSAAGVRPLAGDAVHVELPA
ncbi:MAG: D-alanyl-D-alanine carboxypeptidase [Gaiellales bacterium]|nr:D-alanyl-D-alanine carboxypeptidase [Gaiellales bacterium]